MGLILAIVGPTAVGKSQLAVHLASNYNGEIVNADSRQVYRFMDIGTAKPAPEELSLVKHHLVSIINPDEDFSLAHYHELAQRAIGDVIKRGKLPILVGGSGQYVWSVVENWGLPGVPPDPDLRQRLEERAGREGKEALYDELREVDPDAARRIDPSNVRRVIRALEVYKITSTPISRLRNKRAPKFKSMIIGLTAERSELYRRIDLRVEGMIEKGFVAEVRKLLDMGYSLKLPSMSSIGYRQIGAYLNGEMPLATAVQEIKFETHRFARHQYAWFSLKDNRITWFDTGVDASGATQAVENFINFAPESGQSVR